MIRFFDALDEHVLKAAVANSKVWFGKVQTEDQLRARYRTLVQRSESGEYDPLVRVKVTQSTTKPKAATEVLGWNPVTGDCLERPAETAPKFNLTDLDVPRQRVRTIVRVSGIWFGSFRLVCSCSSLPLQRMQAHTRATPRTVSKQFGVSLAATDVLVEQQPRRDPGKSKFTTRTGGSIDVKQYTDAASGMDVDIGGGTADVFSTPLSATGAPSEVDGPGWS